MIKKWLSGLLLSALALQDGSPSGLPDLLRKQLEEERVVAEYGSFPVTGMFVLIARYQDGTPTSKCWISCDGNWCKYDERQVCASGLPFRADSRGAAIFNPSTLDLEGENNVPFSCYANDGKRVGKITFTPYDGGIFYITVPGAHP